MKANNLYHYVFTKIKQIVLIFISWCLIINNEINFKLLLWIYFCWNSLQPISDTQIRPIVNHVYRRWIRIIYFYGSHQHWAQSSKGQIKMDVRSVELRLIWYRVRKTSFLSIEVLRTKQLVSTTLCWTAIFTCLR